MDKCRCRAKEPRCSFFEDGSFEAAIDDPSDGPSHRILAESGKRDCPRALSASASTVRLGQDRLRGVLESGAVRVSVGHPILHRIANQAKICNFHRRFKLVEHKERASMTNFLEQ
jgi:hypothetical protein